MVKIAKKPSLSHDRDTLMVVVGRDGDRHPGVDVEHDIVVRLLPRPAGRIRAMASYLGHAKPRVVLGSDLESDEE